MKSMRFVAPFISLVLLSVFGFSVAGCSYFFGPKAAGDKPIEMKEESLGCLNTVASDVEAWVKNHVGGPGKPVECLIHSLERFAEKTQGQDSRGWTHAELKHFFATYFERKGKDPGVWLDEILHVKQALFGGERNRLTRTELSRVTSLLRSILIPLKELDSNSDILFLGSDNLADATLSNRAQSVANALNEIRSLIVSELERPVAGRVAFSTRDLPDLLGRLNVHVAELEPFLAVGESAKSILVGGSSQEIAASEWHKVVDVAFSSWILALRLRYQIMDNEAVYGKNIRYLESFAEDALLLLEKSVRAQGSSNLISNEKLSALIDAIEANSWMPMNLRGSTVKGLLPVIFSKLLYGASHADHVEKSHGFGPEQLRVLRGAIEDWVEGQKLLAAIHSMSGLIDADAVAGQLSNQREVGANQGDANSARSRRQLLTFLKEGRPLHADDEGRLRVVSKSRESRVSSSDLVKLNALRAAVSAVVYGYARDAARARDRVGLTDVETQEVYLDVRTLGRDLGFVDSRNTTAGIRTFMEANVFTSFSKGDGLLSLYEAVEWFHLAMGGSGLGNTVHEDLAPECGLKILDVMGKQKLDTGCFRKRFKESVPRYFENLPGFAEWYRAGGDERALQVQEALERAGRGGGFTDQPIDSAEVRAIVPVIHYTESVFAVHDKNLDGVLDSDEIWAAYPLLEPFLKKLTGGKIESEALQKAIFSWLVVFGEPPTQDLIGGGKVVAWSLARHLWRESADRLSVMKIMASLMTVAARERAKKITDFFNERRIWLRRDIKAGEAQTSAKLLELFQCQPVVGDVFTEALRVKVDSIFPPEKPGTVEADIFIKRVKAIIADDRRLEFNCLPF